MVKLIESYLKITFRKMYNLVWQITVNSNVALQKQNWQTKHSWAMPELVILLFLFVSAKKIQTRFVCEHCWIQDLVKIYHRWHSLTNQHINHRHRLISLWRFAFPFVARTCHPICQRRVVWKIRFGLMSSASQVKKIDSIWRDTEHCR